MKKIVCIILTIVLYVLFAFRYEEVQPFSVSEYQTELNNFSTDLTLGRILSSKDAAKQARSVWYDTYGLTAIVNQRYLVSYDSQADIYLVKGTPPRAEGGVPYLLLDAKTGTVLALWHDR